jgi:hypothetical protein
MYGLPATKSAYPSSITLFPFLDQTELIINVPLYKGRKCLAISVTAYGIAETSVNGSER